MMTALVLGAVLTLVGVAGSISACQTDAENRDIVVAVLSGLALAIGLALMGSSALRRGYHRRPLGEPPGDMDPNKVD